MGWVRAFVAIFKEDESLLADCSSIGELLQSPTKVNQMLDALKDEVFDALSYAKEIASSSTWQKIKTTKTKFINEVNVYAL